MAGVGCGERERHEGVEVPVRGHCGEDDSHDPSPVRASNVDRPDPVDGLHSAIGSPCRTDDVGIHPAIGTVCAG